MNPIRDEVESGLFSAVVAVAAGLELSSTLRRIVQAATDLVDARYGALGVLDDDGRVVDFIHVGMDAPVVSNIGEPPKGQGILGLLIDHPVPIRLDDLHTHPSSVGFPANHPDMTSFLGVPVRVRGEVFGNLYLTEKRGGTGFTSDDERTVMALAAAAAVAIENARLYERARQREQWQQAMTGIATAVLEGSEARSVLRLIASKARELTRAQAALIALPGENGQLTVSIVDSDAPGESATHWLGRDIPEGSVAQTAFSLASTVTQPNCKLWSMPDDDDLCSAVALPLNTPERVLGVLLLLWPVESWVSVRSVVDLAESFAAQAAVTLVLSEAQSEHRRLAIYQDRDRIARDLHDLVIQRLFATGLSLQGAAKAGEVPEEVGKRLNKAVDDLDETIKEIRQTIFALHEPMDGPSVSVRGRVMQETAQSAALLGFEPAVRFIGAVDSAIPDELADHMLSALRESLTNAVKHSQASRVDVIIQVDAGELLMMVADDGVGVNATESRRLSGLANLRARAHDLGGSCDIERVSDEGGTRVVWQVPLEVS